jgi:RNA polymerase sigma-70 factor (ECF subfamily)
MKMLSLSISLAWFRPWLALISKMPTGYTPTQRPPEHLPALDGNNFSPFDENEALRGLREMDPQAISTIHSFYYPDIYRFAAYRLNDTHLAEDLVAEVFMRLLEAVKDGRGPRTTLRGWLMATAANRVNDHYRKSYRRKTEELSDDLQAETPSPLTHVEKRERKRAVHLALSKLTPDQQNILSLRFGAGYSLEETAEAIGKNVNAVKQLQFRALASLRRHLGEEPL